MALEFLVRNQRLKLFSGGPVVADSQQYLKARFTFTEDWQGTRKYAQFRRNGEVYTCNIDDKGEVEVPWETLVDQGVVQISAFATNQEDETNKLITTNPVYVKVNTSGIKETELPKAPSLGILGDYVDQSLQEITDHKNQVLVYVEQLHAEVMEAKEHIDQTDYKIYVGENAPTEDITNAVVWINPAEDDGGSDELAEAVTAAQNAANAAEAVAPEYAKTKAVLDNIVSYTNTATEQANIATAKATIADNSATNAAQSYANADAVATQLTEYLATKETLTAPAVDKTLLIEGAAADSKVVGGFTKNGYIKAECSFSNGGYTVSNGKLSTYSNSVNYIKKALIKIANDTIYIENKEPNIYGTTAILFRKEGEDYFFEKHLQYVSGYMYSPIDIITNLPIDDNYYVAITIQNINSESIVDPNEILTVSFNSSYKASVEKEFNNIYGVVNSKTIKKYFPYFKLGYTWDNNGVIKYRTDVCVSPLTYCIAGETIKLSNITDYVLLVTKEDGTYNVGFVESYKIVEDGYYYINVKQTDGTDIDVDTVKTLVYREFVIDHKNIEEYHVGINRTYTSFTQCLKDLQGNANEKIIYIDAGVYDIYEELGGLEFAQTITTTNWRDCSVIVPDNTKIVGIGRVVFNFLPSDEIPSQACNMLSPINVTSSVDIENIVINCIRCRYGIHDDGSSDSGSVGSKHVYKNVQIYKAESSKGYGMAFGAGINSDVSFVFENCIFDSYAIGMSFHNMTSTRNGSIVFSNGVLKGRTASLRLGSLSNLGVDYANDVNIFNTKMNKLILSKEGGTSYIRKNAFNVVMANCGDVEIDSSEYTELQLPPKVY